MGTSRAVSFPEQVVNREGMINVPFAGSVKAAGKTPLDIEDEIVKRAQGQGQPAPGAGAHPAQRVVERDGGG